MRLPVNLDIAIWVKRLCTLARQPAGVSEPVQNRACQSSVLSQSSQIMTTSRQTHATYGT